MVMKIKDAIAFVAADFLRLGVMLGIWLWGSGRERLSTGRVFKDAGQRNGAKVWQGNSNKTSSTLEIEYDLNELRRMMDFGDIRVENQTKAF